MGAFNTYGEMRDALVANARTDYFTYFAGNVGLSYSGWLSPYTRYMAGAVVPTTPAVCTSATPGANVYVPASTTKQFWIVETEFSANSGATIAARFNMILYDRLSHQGGLSGLLNTEQTTNLPTAPLTRYTDGEGVMPFIEVYSSISGINTTLTIRYTNQDGVSNRVSRPVAIVVNQSSNVDSVIPVMLASGDTGCRSVEGVTLLAAGTSAGNFGVTLMKKLCHVPVDTGSYVERQGYRMHFSYGGIVEVMPGAFIMGLWSCSGTSTGSYVMQGRVGIVEK